MLLSADSGTAVNDLQHCWRCVHLSTRKCISTIVLLWKCGVRLVVDRRSLSAWSACGRYYYVSEFFGCLGSYELTEHNVQFLIFTLYIYLHHFNVHVRRRSTRRRTIASVATHSYSSTPRTFVHALRQISRLRPRQLITGRQCRRYPNSTSKTDFPLHNMCSRHSRASLSWDTHTLILTCGQPTVLLNPVYSVLPVPCLRNDAAACIQGIIVRCKRVASAILRHGLIASKAWWMT